MSEWTFLNNHASVLLSLAADPNQRLRDVAAVGITERVGRRNRYELHPAQRHCQVGDLIALLGQR